MAFYNYTIFWGLDYINTNWCTFASPRRSKNEPFLKMFFYNIWRTNAAPWANLKRTEINWVHKLLVLRKLIIVTIKIFYWSCSIFLFILNVFVDYLNLFRNRTYGFKEYFQKTETFIQKSNFRKFLANSRKYLSVIVFFVISFTSFIEKRYID